MNVLNKLRTFAILAAFILAPAAHASAIDSLTLTPNGANTDFAITGTYLPGTPTTPFSSPNTPYTLTFTLPTTPDPALFDFTVPDGLFAISTSAVLNGVTFSTSQVLFFTTAYDGGVVVCLNDFCQDAVPDSPNSWNVFTPQLFTGDLSNPTFISGSQSIDPGPSYYAIAPTPEPSSITLLGTGLLGLGASTWRKLRSKRAYARQS